MATIVASSGNCRKRCCTLHWPDGLGPLRMEASVKECSAIAQTTRLEAQSRKGYEDADSFPFFGNIALCTAEFRTQSLSQRKSYSTKRSQHGAYNRRAEYWP